MRTVTQLLFAGVFSLVACGGGGGAGSAQCLLDGPCTDDSDCEDGALCNLATTPPTCALLDCGSAGSPCSDDALCTLDHLCIDDLCLAQTADTTIDMETDGTDSASGCTVGSSSPCSIPGGGWMQWNHGL